MIFALLYYCLLFLINSIIIDIQIYLWNIKMTEPEKEIPWHESPT